MVHFAEAHLGDQVGLHPLRAGLRQVAAVERGRSCSREASVACRLFRVCRVKPVPTLPV